jgi:hypothetical protein
MTARLSTSAARSTVAIACTVVVLALLSTRIASTQGASGTGQQLSALRQQLSALDRRVKELEKTAVNVDKDKQDEATLDVRITQLEAKVRSLQSQVAAGVGSGGLQASKIVAPFIVVDHAGKQLIRITEGGGGLSRGIYVYNSNESIAAHLGAEADGSGRIYVTKNGALPMVMMAVGSSGPIFHLGEDGKLAVGINKSSLVFYNDSGNPLSLFGTKDRGKGYMELNDSGGSKMVEAGMLNAGKGYVMANPARSSVGINGNPSVLMGGAGR